MTCCNYATDADKQFGTQRADRELARYRRKGPGATARLLSESLAHAGSGEGTLLEIGSGVGGLIFSMLDRGMTRAIAVDASSAFLAAASEEAARRGRTGSIRFVHGDFLAVASEIPQATTVVLDRVVCCYPSWEPLLDEALRRADRYFAYSHPRQIWYTHAANALTNLGRRLRGRSFRTFIHPTSRMEQAIRAAGFSLVKRRQTPIWRVDAYVRSS